MKTIEEILNKCKRTRKVSYAGINAITKFKNSIKEYTVIREDEKYLIATYLVYASIKYEVLVSTLVRTKYSIDEELAVLRQRDTKPEEFAEYNTFVELCKTKAKEFVAERTAYLERIKER